MTLEDDNKSEPETPSSSATPVTAVAPTSSTTEDSPASPPASPPGSKTASIKTKRSFDEISTSQPTSTICDDSTVVASEASQEGDDTNGEVIEEGTTTTAEKMITDEVVSTTTTEEVTEDVAAPVPVSVTFKVVYAKKPYEVSMDLNGKVADLKAELYKQTGVTQAMQKLCFRGNLDDHKTLQESGIKAGVKIMMIGSKIDDVKALDEGKPEVSKAGVAKEKVSKEPLCQQKMHKKILDKGIPEYATPGWINDDCSLPLEPLTGMTNKYGNKVRLTFKFETDEVWIGTKEHTQKLLMTNVKSVISEAIEGHPQYHLMGFQIGPTEASRIWFYWVPAQYVRAIKRAILND